MIRQIIKIDKEKCNGCGLCIDACQEGAIGLVAGKAELLRDDYCDGLGNCLPACPTDAISFEEREALAFNETEVKKNMAHQEPENLACGCQGSSVMAHQEPENLACGCPGSSVRAIQREEAATPAAVPATDVPAPSNQSQLNQWPVQIKLTPVDAPFFNNANLLVSADCAAYAYGNFHHDYMRNKVTVIGCPKLDNEDYSEKLSAIIKNNNIKSVTVVRMEVPCCGGIEEAVKTALLNSGKMIPWQVATISVDGKTLE